MFSYFYFNQKYWNLVRPTWTTIFHRKSIFTPYTLYQFSYFRSNWESWKVVILIYSLKPDHLALMTQFRVSQRVGVYRICSKLKTFSSVSHLIWMRSHNTIFMVVEEPIVGSSISAICLDGTSIRALFTFDLYLGWNGLCKDSLSGIYLELWIY